MIKKLMHTLDAWWSFIFPASDHYQRVIEATTADIIALYNPQHDTRAIWLTSYHHPLSKACVASIKFEHNMRAVRLLGTLVAHYLQHHREQTLCIPVPLHPDREKKRGYNQITMILQEAAKSSPHITVAPRLLTRTRDTTRQTALNRADRLNNMNEAFSAGVLPLNWATFTTIIVWDDVYTTGATLKAAKTALAPHILPHQTLFCVTIAH